MSIKAFYEIAPTSYLFGKTDGPEEKVRQWVLFELLSTYGYNINEGWTNRGWLRVGYEKA
jgi:hypothetical protein